MKHLDIKTIIPELLSDGADWDRIVQLGNLTKLRMSADGHFHHANYESGLLLYAIVRKFKPKRILEIGTGRGFGAFCMATALRDEAIDGKIITIDPIPYTQPQPWPLNDGTGERLGDYSLKEVWERYIDPDLRARVELRHGTSVTVMPALESEGFRPDFIYIDGDHNFVSARHDFFGSLILANQPFRMLLDDYTPASNIYGVRRMVNKYVEPVFETKAIYNDRRWYGESNENVPVSEGRYAQVLIDSQSTKQPIESAFSKNTLRTAVSRHRQWGSFSVRIENAMREIRRRLGLIKPIE